MSRLAIAGLSLGWLACSNAAGQPANFELACDVARLTTAATLLCVRLDTRTGESRVVPLPSLTKSAGEAGPMNQYQLVCASTSVAQELGFQCIRLNRVTGDMALLDLDKLKRTGE